MAELTSTSLLTSDTGITLPVIGLGTALGDGDVLEKAIHEALEIGYRMLDTATLYNNEASIGRALNHIFSSGKLKREDIFITTKLPHRANNPQGVRECLETSLKDLQVDYVDLYLIHHAVGILPGEPGADLNNPKLDYTTDHVAIWKEMEKQVDAGRAKCIGLSNFNTRQIERIIKIARIPPANVQTELYLYNQDKGLQEFCRNRRITLTSYSTLGNMGAPVVYKSTVLNPLQDPVVVRIAKAHGKTAAQVLLRHMLQSGAAVIPKSVNPTRLRENFQVFDFQLSVAEMAELNGLDKGEDGRMFGAEKLKDHPEYPFPK